MNSNVFKIIVFVVVSTIFPVPGQSALHASDPDVRPSVLAGSWYPDDSESLKAMLNDYLTSAKPAEPQGDLVAAVAPHAGYVYSGQVAAFTFSLMKNKAFDTVILIGPSHHVRFPGASVNLQHYQTPLGIVKTDRELGQSIISAGNGLLFTNSAIHAREHCLEIETPFIQTVLPEAKILPILMGENDLDVCRRLSDILVQSIKGKKVLLLASTDLSHFLTGDEARKMDGKLIEHVRAFDPAGLYKDLESGAVQACGGAPLVTVMLAAEKLGARNAKILKYNHSGDVSGDNSRVVGYLSAVFVKEKKVGEAGLLDKLKRLLTPAEAFASEDDAKKDALLTLEERKLLLELARKTIETKLLNRTEKKKDYPAGLNRPCGAFVTLKKNGELRGCIGTLSFSRPLYQVIETMSIQAAFHDPRFSPLTADELNDLLIEISVLSPFTEVKNIKEIEVGKHGLLVVREPYRGLLLPQVPVEQGWDLMEFLDHTCLKAGLPPSAWRDSSVKLFKFTGQVFSEKEIKPSNND